tara:strand:- start:19112 stop:19477 length:366 start_codon:yes stop_codon:yes gene_type:complete
MIKLKIMKTINNVIPMLQDKSIFNIISYALKNNKIKTSKIEDAIKNNTIQSNSLIIIDNDLDNEYIKKNMQIIKKLDNKPYILLAISKNYRYVLEQPLSPLISGIIYKPFDIEKLFQAINN